MIEGGTSGRAGTKQSLILAMMVEWASRCQLRCSQVCNIKVPKRVG